jgi:hypothetical protein
LIVATPARFELAVFRLEIECFIQLSYGVSVFNTVTIRTQEYTLVKFRLDFVDISLAKGCPIHILVSQVVKIERCWVPGEATFLAASTLLFDHADLESFPSVHLVSV